jgi:hypothetical protein
MVYGELFWQEGLAVYDISDKDLNETYNVPEDHMLTGVLNVTYEYPLVTLLFYAALAAIEPGIYNPHYIANWVLVILVHINLLLFLYIGRGHEDKRWFKQFFAIFYVFGLTFSIGFAKAEPLTDLIWLTAIVLLQRKKYWEGNAILGLAVQTSTAGSFAQQLRLFCHNNQSILFRTQLSKSMVNHRSSGSCNCLHLLCV